MAQALEILRARKEAEPESFEAAASDEEIREANARLPFPIPSAWENVLRISRSFALDRGDSAFAFLAPDQITTPDTDDRPFARRLSTGDLVIGDEFRGGLLTLSIAAQSGGDCLVRWVTSEGPERDMRWETVPLFLRWLLE